MAGAGGRVNRTSGVFEQLPRQVKPVLFYVDRVALWRGRLNEKRPRGYEGVLHFQALPRVMRDQLDRR
jgi:hypothetical protein